MSRCTTGVEALTAALTPAGLKAAIKRFIRSVREGAQPHHQGFISPTTSLALANAVLNGRHPLCLWCRHRNGWVSMKTPSGTPMT